MIAAMKTQVIVGKTLAVGAAAALFAAWISACSGDRNNTSSGGGGEGGESPSASSAGGGTGGNTPDASVNPLEDLCDELCGYLGSIDCNAWPNCSTECTSGFNAPTPCKDEVEALIGCWVMNKMTFTCTATQLIPPSSCQALEAAFNACFTGPMPTDDGGMPVTCQQAQTKNATETTCSAKSPCDDNTEIKSYCSLPGGAQAWACSCYKGTNLLGTCSATMDVCENYKGCCGAFFFPGAMP
jgi:hypothetical protein